MGLYIPQISEGDISAHLGTRVALLLSMHTQAAELIAQIIAKQRLMDGDLEVIKSIGDIVRHQKTETCLIEALEAALARYLP